MQIHFLRPDVDRYDSAVDDAIAACNGDVRGTLKALIIANEFLEREAVPRPHLGLIIISIFRPADDRLNNSLPM
jgi:hypothetical protein